MSNLALMDIKDAIIIVSFEFGISKWWMFLQVKMIFCVLTVRKWLFCSRKNLLKMIKQSKIVDLLKSKDYNREVNVKGWVRTKEKALLLLSLH